MKNQIEDPDTIPGLVSSKRSIFDELFYGYSKKVYGFAKSYHLCHQDAEEIVQDVFVKLWNVIDHIDTSQSASSYIITMTKNVILNFLRARAVRQNFISEHFPSNKISKAENAFHYNELHARFNTIVDSLPEQQQKIFKMVFFEGTTVDDISANLGLSKRTVEHTLYLSRKSIKNQLTEFCK